MRRGSWTAVLALVVVTATACSPHSNEGGTVRPRTEQPPLSQTQAMAVVRHYDQSINAALDAKSQQPLDMLETGTALKTSLSDRLFATDDHPASLVRHPPAGEQVYLPPDRSYPQWFVSESPYADDRGQVEFSLFERAQPGAPWSKALRSWSSAQTLSPPFVRGGVVQEGSAQEVSQARSALADVDGYFETGRNRGRLTDVMLVQNDAEYFWARLSLNSGWLTGTVSCSPDVEAPLGTMHTEDGALLVLGSITCSYTLRAKPGQGIRLDPSVRQWGITQFHVHAYRYDEEKQLVLSVTPDGAAKVLGYTSTQVDERLLCGC
jgi:hypothetical protein